MGWQTRVEDGRVQLWLSWPLPGGWVCGEPVEGLPGGYSCGMPVESEPCPLHPPLPTTEPSAPPQADAERGSGSSVSRPEAAGVNGD